METTIGNLARDSIAHNSGASRAALLAEYFRHHRNEWIDGRVIAKIAGAYAWRTRVSDVRRAPYCLLVENRQRRARAADGQPYTISEYRCRSEAA